MTPPRCGPHVPGCMLWAACTEGGSDEFDDDCARSNADLSTADHPYRATGAPTTGRSAAHVGRVGGLAVALGGAPRWAMPALAAGHGSRELVHPSSTRGSDAGSATIRVGSAARARCRASPDGEAKSSARSRSAVRANRSSSGHLSRRRHRKHHHTDNTATDNTPAADSVPPSGPGALAQHRWNGPAARWGAAILRLESHRSTWRQRAQRARTPADRSSSIFFGDGTEDHPNGGLIIGNGYSWTARKPALAQRLASSGNGGIFGNGGDGYNGGTAARPGWFRNGGNGGTGVADGTAETVAPRPDIRRWRYGRRGREWHQHCRQWRQRWLAGLCLVTAGKGGAGGAADVNLEEQEADATWGAVRGGTGGLWYGNGGNAPAAIDSRRRHRRQRAAWRCHRPAFDMGNTGNGGAGGRASSAARAATAAGGLFSVFANGSSGRAGSPSRP